MNRPEGQTEEAIAMVVRECGGRTLVSQPTLRSEMKMRSQ